MLARGDEGGIFALRAYRNLPEPIGNKINRRWDDDLNDLVLVSGEAVSIHGEALTQFKASKWGQAVLAVPVIANEQIIGLKGVMRKSPQVYSQDDLGLLAIMAEHTALALIKVGVLHTLRAREQALQQSVEIALASEHSAKESMRQLNRDVRGALLVSIGYIEMVLDGQWGDLTDNQIDALRVATERLRKVESLLEKQQSEGVAH